ncbi:MAG: hypothetical protein Q9166_004032 [cf. Caloplaca sp. 2 TL-2023]
MLDDKCKALTQHPRTKNNTGHRCSRAKIVDDTKLHGLKSTEELVADELCRQHKLMKERFMHMIIPQLVASGSPLTSTTAAGTHQKPHQASELLVTAQASVQPPAQILLKVPLKPLAAYPLNKANRLSLRYRSLF